jgi:hypothetical protein
LKEPRVGVDVVEQLVGERPLGGEIGDEALEPAAERLPGVGVVKLRG